VYNRCSPGNGVKPSLSESMTQLRFRTRFSMVLLPKTGRVKGEQDREAGKQCVCADKYGL
jgi:hypothetical protein